MLSRALCCALSISGSVLVAHANDHSDRDASAPWFASSVRAEMTQADSAAAAARAAPQFVRWISLAPANGVQAHIATVQLPEGIRVYGRAVGGADAAAGEWTLRWSTLRELELPPIGWQRAARPLLSDADCTQLGLTPQDLAYCPQWLKLQQAHRKRIQQAFTPSYRISAGQGTAVVPDAWSEPALTVAWGGPLAVFAEIDPTPAGPVLTWSDAEQFGFSLMIPWSAWPLTRQSELRSLYLQVSYCPPQGPCTHAPAADGALELVLSEPLSLRSDPCGQSSGYTPNDEPWFLRIADSLPDARPVATSNYAFVNPGGGYLDRPDANRSSPELWTRTYRTQPVDVPGDMLPWRVCLPEWRLWPADQPSFAATRLSPAQLEQIENDPGGTPWHALSHPYWNSEQPQFVETQGTDGEFETRTLDAHRVVLLQPYRVNPPISGEGQNGACDTAQFALWILDVQEPSLRQALSLSDYGPDLCAGTGLISAQLSADGRQVDSVRRRYDTESSSASGVLEITERHCLDDVSNSYLHCGSEVHPVQD